MLVSAGPPGSVYYHHPVSNHPQGELSKSCSCSQPIAEKSGMQSPAGKGSGPFQAAVVAQTSPHKRSESLLARKSHKAVTST